MLGTVQGTTYRRPHNRYLSAEENAKIEWNDGNQNDRLSVNPPKIDIILLLIAQRVISFRSGILLEPIIRLLSIDTVSVRKLAFDLLSHIQRAYGDKRKAVMELFMVALKYPNSVLRSEVLRLICFMLDTFDDDLGVSSEEVLARVLPLLDDDSTRVKE